MKFPLSWLKLYLDTQADAPAIAEALTRLGLEVEGIDDPAAALAPFRIARVLTAEPHPQADKLRVLSVDAGDGPVQVVCGGPNARAGLVGIFGPPGATVPANAMVLKVAAIRGVESRGMMCSLRELGLGEEHDGIAELPADAPVGAAYAAWAGLDDPVFDVAITPNRQDCMGVHGIARDLAAAGVGTLRALDTEAVAGAYACPVPVATEDAEGCPAFLGRVVRGVRNGPSPEWLQRLLRGAGLRPISALVDVTNYLTIGFGRPLHVYDVAKLSGGLTARRARDGETVEALNGRTYALTRAMTVIADERAVHDIGGIMGGSESGVSEATTDVLIEAAYFAAERIGATGRALNIVSDARARFERGVDPGFVAPGLELATRLILELCGGEPSAVAVAGAVPPGPAHVRYDPKRCGELAGIDVPVADQARYLAALGFVSDRRVHPWEVHVPTWRRDVHGAADLVEEIVRLHGLDKVPSVPLPRAPGVAAQTATPAQRIERRARRTLAARGLDEAVTWSFVSEAAAAMFGEAAWRLENPLSAELAVMRPSLLPGLVMAAGRNAARGAGDLRLFEIGRRYLAEGERATAAVLLTGDASARDWRGGKAHAADAYDAKAEAVALLAALGAPVERLAVQSPASAHYHPGRSARLVLGKAVLAEFGALHPRVLAEHGVANAVAAEVFLDALPPRRRAAKGDFAPPPLQAVRRDFAFLYPADAPADALVRAVAGADKALVAGVTLFDRFAGAGVPEGMVSLGVEVLLQPREATLTEADLAAVNARIVAAAGKLGASLRG